MTQTANAIFNPAIVITLQPRQPNMSDSELDQMLEAPQEVLRSILSVVCDDENVRKKALAHYHVVQASGAWDNPPSFYKRKAQEELHICIRCDEPFSKAENVFGDCFYHPGELLQYSFRQHSHSVAGDMEPDYDSHVWADHDERCHGTIDSDFCRKEYPDGFIWDCCEQTGSAVGCKEGEHKADPRTSKKGREEVSEDESDDSEDLDESEEDEDEEYE